MVEGGGGFRAVGGKDWLFALAGYDKVEVGADKRQLPIELCFDLVNISIGL